MKSAILVTMSVHILLSSLITRGFSFRPTPTRLQSESTQLSRIQGFFTSDALGSSQNHRCYQSKRLWNANNENEEATKVPLLRSEGLLAVYKPLDWTSSDVVSFIRKILERDARERGADPARPGRKNKSRQIKVGHGGTLDPLATGVLVIGVGKGTKELQGYLTGSKKYTAEGELGFETTTLDMDKTGHVTKTAPYDHVTEDMLKEALPSFTGIIQQKPPLYSALKRGGKKLYESAREGATEEDVKIEAREVETYHLELLDTTEQRFKLDVECGGGFYVRSLIRDIGYTVGSVATMTALERTKQGQFTIDDCLWKDDWTPDNIFAAIDKINAVRQKENHLAQ